jgi:hypothetical protein
MVYVSVCESASHAFGLSVLMKSAFERIVDMFITIFPFSRWVDPATPRSERREENTERELSLAQTRIQIFSYGNFLKEIRRFLSRRNFL